MKTIQLAGPVACAVIKQIKKMNNITIFLFQIETGIIKFVKLKSEKNVFLLFLASKPRPTKAT
jgi:hypothetical protein